MKASPREAARIEAVTSAGQDGVSQTWAPHRAAMDLEGEADWQTTCLTGACSGMKSIMFKITQHTTHDFSLAEILLMAAMNEIEVARNPCRRDNPKGTRSELGNDRHR